jgi:hypothetical protein
VENPAQMPCGAMRFFARVRHGNTSNSRICDDSVGWT